MQTTTSNSLAKEIQKGNREAFSKYFRENYNRYVAFALRYLDAKSDAADIVQEVFIKLWEKKKTIDIDKSLQAYMYASVRNACLNFIRDHQSRYTELTEELVDEPTTTSSNEHLSKTVTSLVEELPERQREAFQLSRFEGLQHEEIAEIMKVSPRTVNNHIVAALKNLRDLYERQKNQSVFI